MPKQSPIIVGVFDQRIEADRALSDLHAAGFASSEIGMVIRGDDAVRGGAITDAVGTKDGSGALVGAATGSVVGGVLGALAAMMIPGVGPVLAGGILASALGFAAAGAATGGILGAMSGLGISEDEARIYQREFDCGKAIVAVKGGDQAALAVSILRRHGGYDAASCSMADPPARQA